MKKSFFFLFVSVASYNYAHTPVTSGPNWTVSNLPPNKALYFPTEITFGPDGFLRITEKVGNKMVRVTNTNGVIIKSSDENIQEITVFDL